MNAHGEIDVNAETSRSETASQTLQNHTKTDEINQDGCPIHCQKLSKKHRLTPHSRDYLTDGAIPVPSYG